MTPDELNIVHYPHPALRWKSKPVHRVDDTLRSIVSRMFELMNEASGIGLAANQIALPYQLFVISIMETEDHPAIEQVLVNPVLQNQKGSHETEEGCLSLPNLYGPVKRATSVDVRAYDLDGNEIHFHAESLHARVIQHEHDHLHGRLFIDRMSEMKKRELSGPLEDFRYHHRQLQQHQKLESDEHLRDDLRKWEQHLTG